MMPVAIWALNLESKYVFLKVCCERSCQNITLQLAPMRMQVHFFLTYEVSAQVGDQLNPGFVFNVQLSALAASRICSQGDRQSSRVWNMRAMRTVGPLMR